MPDDSLQHIANLVQPSLRHCGVELFDAQWDGATGTPTLRLLIEKPGGVSLDDCERVSVAVSAVLDAYDPIEAAYQLEVSSPGAERSLRDVDDWRRHVGFRVNVRYRSGDGDTVVEGRLLSVSEASVEVEIQAGRGRRADLRGAQAVTGAGASRKATSSVTIPAGDLLAGRLAVEI